MNLGALGSIAGGISSGLSNGQKFEENRRKAELEKLQRAAETSAGNAMFGGGDVGGLSNLDQSQTPPPQQQMPGQPSQPMQPPTAQFGQPRMGTPGAPPRGVMPDPGTVQSYIVQAAQKRGIDPATALKVYKSEGGGAYTGDKGSSFGPYQLHYGGVASGGNSVGGLGDEFTKATGLNARDPSTWQKQVDFALDKAKGGGWGPWHGAQRVGVGDQQGIGGGAPQPGQGQPPAQGGQQSPISQASPQLQQMVQRIKQQNPGAPPAQMFRALQQLMPFIKQEDQQVIREQGLQMREALAQQHAELTRFLEGGRNDRQQQSQQGQNQREDQREDNRNQRFTQGQQGQDNRLQQREAGQEQRQNQAITSREGIAGRSADERERHDKAGEATGAGRLALAGQGQEQRAAQATQRLKQSQQRIDMLKDNAQRASDTAVRNYWQKKLEAEQKNYTSLRNAEANLGRSGLSQPKIDAAVGDIEKKLGGDDKPRNEDAPPSAAQEASPPPEALKALQEGHETTFKNGQVWTIKDGKPSRVK